MASPIPRNIYIVGAQCTGKTTLVKALETHFTTSPSPSTTCLPAIIREVARSVLHTYAFTASDIRSSPERALELQRLILLAQAAAERQALETADWFISDRSGVDPICYALSHAGDKGAASLLASEEWRELNKRMAEGLVVVSEAGADWLNDDGVRLMPLDQDEWIGFHKLFCSLLDAWGLSYVVLPAGVTDLAERVDFVLSRAYVCGRHP